MYKLWLTVISFCLYITLSPLVWSEDLGLTDKEITERLVRLEEGQNFIKEEIKIRFENLNNKIDLVNEGLNSTIEKGNNGLQNEIGLLNTNLNKRIDTIETIMICGFGVLFAMIGTLLGFIINAVVRGTKVPIISPNIKLGGKEEYEEGEGLAFR